MHRSHGRLTRATETIAGVQAFRKRHGDAQREHGQYAAQPTTVDFAHYRSVLKNQAVVDEAEKIIQNFKPVTYDVSAHVKAIEAFEAKAVRVGVVVGALLIYPFIGCESEGDRGEN